MAANDQRKSPVVKPGYEHNRWLAKRRFCRFLMRVLAFTLLVKLDCVEGVENVPESGSAIFYINHIAFVDPIIALYVISRDIVPMAKVEVYDYPLVGIFPRLWGVIPVHREEIDRRAVQSTLDVLTANECVLVAPEGTRQPQLATGKEGIAYIAVKSGAPLIPVAIQGSLGFPAFRLSRRWKAAGARVIIGRPFTFRQEFSRPNRETLRKMTDEAMYVLAAMLPEELRGVYSDLLLASQETLEWL